MDRLGAADRWYLYLYGGGRRYVPGKDERPEIETDLVSSGFLRTMEIPLSGD